MSERLIFVSCGQKTRQEKALGRAIQQAVDATPGFKAYFAEDVQSLTALRDHVFDAIRRCAGAVILLHQRDGSRSSLWVNQEVAMLAYRQYVESAEIPVLVFKESGVMIEGTMSELILNPQPLSDAQTVLAAVGLWLAREAEHGPLDRRPRSVTSQGNRRAHERRGGARGSWRRRVSKADSEIRKPAGASAPRVFTATRACCEWDRVVSSREGDRRK